jgi:hypothetical protein
MIAAYATAAGAAGVALLAAAPSAEAEIVYTKTRVTITQVTVSYPLDLNHDGITDFNVGFCSCRPHGTAITVSSSRNVGNGVIAASGFLGSALPLVSGAPIGPKQMFRVAYGIGVSMAYDGSYGYRYSGGAWMGVIDHYLGLKFMIDGEVHYGWARMTITKGIGHVVLSGYAYETVANKHLKAGQASDAPEDEAKNAATLTGPAAGPSLGMLAGGAEAMEIWRRKEKYQVA